MKIEIVDRTVDPDWLEPAVQDLWELVKSVRQTRGPRERTYILGFEKSVVEITIRRSSP